MSLTPEEVVRGAEADGLRFRIIPPDVLVKGPAEAYERWLPAIREVKPELLRQRQAEIDRLRPDFDLVMTADGASDEQIATRWRLTLRDFERLAVIYAVQAAFVRSGWRPSKEPEDSIVGHGASVL